MRNATRTKGQTTPEAVDEGRNALRLRFVFGPKQIIGPGRVDLLELIDRTGSLAAAGRSMKMSYKRAWLLVEELNGTFDEPLVQMSRGGSGHGGAVLTPLGRDVMERYRRMLARSQAVVEEDLHALRGRLAPAAGPRD